MIPTMCFKGLIPFVTMYLGLIPTMYLGLIPTMYLGLIPAFRDISPDCDLRGCPLRIFRVPYQHVA